MDEWDQPSETICKLGSSTFKSSSAHILQVIICLQRLSHHHFISSEPSSQWLAHIVHAITCSQHPSHHLLTVSKSSSAHSGRAIICLHLVFESSSCNCIQWSQRQRSHLPTGPQRPSHNVSAITCSQNQSHHLLTSSEPSSAHSVWVLILPQCPVVIFSQHPSSQLPAGPQHPSHNVWAIICSQPPSLNQLSPSAHSVWAIISPQRPSGHLPSASKSSSLGYSVLPTASKLSSAHSVSVSYHYMLTACKSSSAHSVIIIICSQRPVVIICLWRPVVISQHVWVTICTQGCCILLTALEPSSAHYVWITPSPQCVAGLVETYFFFWNTLLSYPSVGQINTW